MLEISKTTSSNIARCRMSPTAILLLPRFTEFSKIHLEKTQMCHGVLADPKGVLMTRSSPLPPVDSIFLLISCIFGGTGEGGEIAKVIDWRTPQVLTPSSTNLKNPGSATAMG